MDKSELINTVLWSVVFQVLTINYICSIMYIISVIIIYKNVDILVATCILNMTTYVQVPEIKESISAFCLLVGYSL